MANAVSEDLRRLFDDTHLYDNERALEIIERVKDLEDSERMLQALENAGVDNWSGYHEAYCEAHAEEMEDW